MFFRILSSSAGTGFVKKFLLLLLFFFLLWATDVIFAAAEGTKEGNAPTVGGFDRGKLSIVNRFDEEKQEIAGREKELEKNLEKTQTEISRLEGEIHQKRGVSRELITILNVLRNIALPIPIWVAFSDSLFGGNISKVFFFITALNLFLYFAFYEKNAFPKQRKIILIILGVILFFAFPAFGEEIAVTPPAPANDPFLGKCDAVAGVLRMGELEKSILILKDKRIKVVELQELKVKNPYLKPWKTVAIDTPEYFYTLSALYLENNEKGKAISALKNLFDLPSSSFDWPHFMGKYNEMLSDVIFFYVEENMVSAVFEVAKKIASIMTDVSVLLSLSDFLYQKNMHESAGELQKSAMALAARTQDRLKMADFLIKRQQTEDASKLLECALEEGPSYTKTRPLEDVVDIIRFGLEKNLKSVAEKGIKAGLLYCRSSAGNALKFAQFLFDNKRVEDTSTALDAAYGFIFSLGYPKEMRKGFLEITGFAIRNNFFEIAGKATEKFMVSLISLKLDPFTFYLPPPSVLECEKFLPTDEEISLPVYFAALLQKTGLMSEAQRYYEMAVSHDLEKIVGNYGYRIEGRLNHFYYLREFLKLRGDMKRMKKLEPIYSKVEEVYLKKMEMETIAEMDSFRKRANEEIKRREASIKTRLKEIENAKAELASLTRQNIFSFLQIPVFSVFLLMVLVGIVVKSYQEAKITTRFKAFSFSWKFCECAGWFYVYTLIGMPIGIPFILVGQLLGHVARIQQNTEKREGVS